MWMILAIVLVIVTAVSARFLLIAVTQLPVRQPSGEYNVLAQRVSRWYKVASWGLVTFFLFSTLWQLFWTAIQAVI